MSYASEQHIEAAAAEWAAMSEGEAHAEAYRQRMEAEHEATSAEHAGAHETTAIAHENDDAYWAARAEEEMANHEAMSWAAAAEAEAFHGGAEGNV